MKKNCSEMTLEQALNMALNVAEHLRKYLPNDDHLSDADKLALVMLENVKQFIK